MIIQRQFNDMITWQRNKIAIDLDVVVCSTNKNGQAITRPNLIDKLKCTLDQR